MENEFSLFEMQMIQGMIKKYSYAEIAGIMDKTESMIKDYVLRFTKDKSIDTRQSQVDQVINNRVSKRAIKKAEKQAKDARKEVEIAIKNEMKRLKLARENEVLQERKKRREPLFATKIIDYSKMISIRIDRKTVLQVPVGTNIEAVKEKYRQRIKKIEPIALRYKKVKKFKPL